MDFLGDHNKIPIPIINKVIPNHEVIVKDSPNTKTPNKAAVNGSTNESVTAVDEET